MSTIQIYHNPRCSKSRQTLQILQATDHDIEIIEYLKTPPDVDELAGIVQKLDITPRALLRKTEKQYKELALDDQSLSDTRLLEIMVAHPKLIERPIVIHGDKARIGRPPEAVEAIL